MDRKVYTFALKGVTRHALNEAVKFILHGGLNHNFFPSPVELRRACETVMAPEERQHKREQIRAQQARENREFMEVRRARTPEAIARVKAAYEKFCESYEAAKPAREPGVNLNPELVAQIPDAPSTFKKLGLGG